MSKKNEIPTELKNEMISFIDHFVFSQETLYIVELETKLTKVMGRAYSKHEQYADEIGPLIHDYFKAYIKRMNF